MNKFLLCTIFLSWCALANAQFASRTINKTAVSYKNDHRRFASGSSDASFHELRRGQLWSVGRNMRGQLGIGNTSDRLSPVIAVIDSNWTVVSIGYEHAAGIRSDGSLWAWGYPDYFQLGTGNNTQQNSPVRIGSANDWVAVACGYKYMFVIKADGSLWGCGLGGDGQMGQGPGPSTSYSTIVRIGTDNKWTCISAGKFHVNAVKTDGTLWAWGYNNVGQLGDGSNTTRFSPVQVGSDNDWVYCTSGADHSYGLKADGRLYAWGAGTSGQLGQSGNTAHQSNPVPIPGTWTYVTAGFSSGHGIKADGTFWAWGANDKGQLGIGNTTNQTAPVKVNNDQDWTAVYCATYTAVICKSNGSIWGCGYNGFGELGIGSASPTLQSSLREVRTSGSLIYWAGMDAGFNHNLAVKSDGTLWSWGNNTSGQLGNGNTTSQPVAAKIGNNQSWVGVSAGKGHSLAIRADGTVFAWGNNGNGQLGYISGATQTDPLMVGTDNDWTSISAGDGFSFGLKANGTLWAWGKNDKGQLGNNSNTGQNMPVQIAGTGWVSVAAGGRHTLALKANGTLWSWGDNSDGQLGIGNNTDYNTPQQVGGDNKWTSIAAGDAYSLALRNDGTIWAWGNNANGQLGQGNTVSSNQPVQIGAATDWIRIAAGDAHAVAVKVNGNIYGWGRNQEGQLGLSTITDQLLPVIVSGQQDALLISAGGNFSGLLNVNRGLICMSGINTDGQLGLGSTTNMQTFTCPGSCTPPPATITPAGPTTVCAGATVQLDANTGSGYIYRWLLGGSPISGATNASYTATASGDYAVEVTSGGCYQTSQSTTVTVANPTITLAGNGQICPGIPTVNIGYTSTGNPTSYSITWGGTARGAGFQDVINATLTGGSIPITVPANTGAGNYIGSITVSNSNCSSGGGPLQSIGVQVYALPAIGPITGGDSVCVSGSVNLSNAEPGGTWISEHSAIAIVNSSGTVIGANPGNTRISYTIIDRSTGCSSVVYQPMKVNPIPAISLGAVPEVCAGSRIALQTYTATGNPTRFHIQWDGTAQGQGFQVARDSLLTGSPFSIPVSSTAAPNTYSGFLIVEANGCMSNLSPLSVRIINAPAITLGASPSVCAGVTTAALAYTSVTGGATEYRISWDAAAQTAGFSDVPYSSIPSGSFNIALPGGVPAGVYNGTLTVRNTTTGCSSPADFSVTVNEVPSVTLGSNPSLCPGAGITNVWVSYSGAAGNPSSYSIAWDPSASAAGFLDITSATLPSSAIPIDIPSPTPASGSYSGTLTVSNGACTSSTQSIGLSIHALPSVSFTSAADTVCTAASVQFSGTPVGGVWMSDNNGIATVNNSGLVTGASPGSTAIIYEVTDPVTNCVSEAYKTIQVIPPPVITPGTLPEVCAGVATASLPYTVSGAPVRYRIVWGGTASTAGFIDVNSAPLPSSGPIVITLPANVPPAVYSGTLFAEHGHCASDGVPISVKVKTVAGITPGTIAAVCAGTTSVSLSYTSPVGNPNRYSIVWNAAPGFGNVTDAPLSSSPVSITIPGSAAPGTYTGTLTVRNSDTNCVSTNYSISVKVKTAAGITPGTIAAVCSGTTSVSLPYTAPVGNPNRYSIVWNSAPGFTNVTDAALPSSPVSISIPAGAAPGTYTGTLTVRNSDTNCVSTNYNISVKVKTVAGITPGAIAAVCAGTTSASLPYTSPVGNPNRYSIVWNAAPGFTNVTDAALPSSAVNISVPSGATPGTYTGTLTVRNSDTDCISTNYSISVKVKTVAGITPGAITAVCAGTTSVSMPYTSPVGNPNRYSIVWNSAPGFSNVTDAVLPSSPISISIPGGAAPGTYTGTLTVRNSDTNCVSTNYSISVKVKTVASVTLGTNPSVCVGAPSVTLPYTAPVGSPNRYSIAWSSGALTAGFTDVSNATLPGSPITITVPTTAAPGAYGGVLTVRNTDTGCVSTDIPITVTTTTQTGITLGATPEVCTGVTAATHTYSGASGSPDQYSISWHTAAATAGFAHVTNGTLSGGTISLAVPGSAAPATYSGTLHVRNSAAGCLSDTQTIRVTVLPLPAITLGATPEACTGDDSVLLTYTGTSLSPDHYSIVWNGAASAAGFTNITNSVLSVGAIALHLPVGLPAGTYSGDLTVANPTCTSLANSFSIIVHETPVAVVTTTGPTDICQGDSIVLDGSSPLSGVSYEWWNGTTATGMTGADYAASVSGDYTVVVTNAHCRDTSSAVRVTVYNPPLIQVTSGDTAFCEGGWVVLNAVSSDTNLSYRWKNGQADIPMAFASFYEVITTGSYSVVVSRVNVSNCRDSSPAVEVTVHPLPQPVLNRSGDTFFTTGGYSHYQWYRNTQVIPGATDTVHKATAPGAYMVSVTDSNGCMNNSATYNLNQLGVPAVAATWDIHIYPNPSAGIVKIESPVSVNVTVNGMDGKLLLQRNDIKEIDLRPFAEGVYLLRVYTPEGRLLKNERIIKTQF